MAGSEKKKKLKGLFWQVANLKQVTNIYATSVQRILNELWTEFPKSIKSEKDEYFDFDHYEILVSCFNRNLNKKSAEEVELADQLNLEALESSYDQRAIENNIVNILCSGGRGLSKKITSNKQRGKRKARIDSTRNLYILFSKSYKKMTDNQEYATRQFTDQVKSHYLDKVENKGIIF